MRFFQTAIAPLPDGESALAARLAAIDDAKGRLDISLFILKPDRAGHLFVDHILKAADRGVKVRMLFDDLFNRYTAKTFWPMANHPNIDVRIFNPYTRYAPTMMSLMLNYERGRRRMHSRFQITDDKVAIIGGRNLADEYFKDNGSSRFIDFEIALEGGAVSRMAEAFALYWHDPWSVPLDEVNGRHTKGALDRLRHEIRAFLNKADLKPAPSGPPPLLSAQAAFLTDNPSKLRRPDYVVSQSHFNEIANARDSVLIVTPYFIPRQAGLSLLSALAHQGVSVTIVTNSLASTNHPVVHGGYARYREPLLSSGVRICEMNPITVNGGTGRGPMRTLHGKFTVIDSKRTIVTTMNFDPISITGNLESSVIVEDPRFADWVALRANPRARNLCHDVTLAENGELHRTQNARPHDEAGAALHRHLISSLVALLQIEGML